jgi:TPR repeat protein
MFLSGNGVGVNKAEAARFFRLAADIREAQLSLARMLFDGDGVPQDKEEAVTLPTLGGFEQCRCRV